MAERAGTISLARRDDVGKPMRRFLSSESLRPGLSGTAGWAMARRDLVDGYPHGQELAELTARVLDEAQRQLRAERPT